MEGAKILDAPAQSYERAYRVWRDCGQNLTETGRILAREHNYPISRRSLQEWKKKFGWEERAAREDAARGERQDAASDDSLLTVLLTQKKKYEQYFDTLALGAVDNQAIYAYNNILKTLLDIRERTDAGRGAVIDRPKLFLEDLEFVAEHLKQHDPEGLRAFAKNFDGLVRKFKEQEHANPK